MSDDYESEFQSWKGNKIQELKYHRAICMMICGADLGEVAKELNTTKRTIQRYFNSPEFNENLTRAIHLTFKKALSRAALYADRAVELLIEIAEDKDTPTKYRLQAIQQISDMCFKARMEYSINTPNPTKQRMYEQQSLLSSYSVVKVAGEGIEKRFSAKMNDDNQRAIWNELYPNEPYPEDEELRRFFNKNELDADD